MSEAKYFLAINLSIIAFSFVLSQCQSTGEHKTKVDLTNIDTIMIGKQKSPDTSELILKARLSYGFDNYTEALEVYEGLLKTDSLNGEFNFRVGVCLTQLHKDSAGVKYFLKAVRLNYRKIDSYRFLGMVYVTTLYDKERAIMYLSKVFRD